MFSITHFFRGYSAGLLIRQPRVQVSPWPLSGFVLGSHKSKSLIIAINSQLVCLLPVGILNPLVPIVIKINFLPTISIHCKEIRL